MEIKPTVRVALAALVAMILVEAAVLAYVVNDRSSISDQLGSESQRAEMASALVNVSAALQNELSVIDRSTSACAMELKGKNLNGTGARDALQSVVNDSSYVYNVITVDTNGTVMAVQPAIYSHLEGRNVSSTDPVRRVFEDGRPIISGLFEVLDGYEAVIVAYPTLDGQGRVNGAVSTMFRPAEMMQNITRMIDGGRVGSMVMQGDGVLIYDPDGSQVGKNTFTDPIYQDFTEIKRVAYRMINESSGSDSYSFKQTGADVHKDVMWTTVVVLGIRWTVAVNMVSL